ALQFQPAAAVGRLLPGQRLARDTEPAATLAMCLQNPIALPAMGGAGAFRFRAASQALVPFRPGDLAVFAHFHGHNDWGLGATLEYPLGLVNSVRRPSDRHNRRALAFSRLMCRGGYQDDHSATRTCRRVAPCPWWNDCVPRLVQDRGSS